MSRVAAIILSGGRGLRLGGVIKAGLRVGGQTMLAHVAARLATADVLILAHVPLDPSHLPPLAGAIALPDLPTPYGGPLAGLAAAVDWALAQPEPPHTLVLAPADSPLLPPDGLSRLTAALDTAPAALAAFAGQTYPTSSAWRLSAIAHLPAALHAGTAPHALKHLASSLGAAVVDFPAHAGGDPFANANTMAELLALQARLR